MQGNPPGSAERRRNVCEVAECAKQARTPTLRCKAHGGGIRCFQPGCDKSAVDGYDRCRKDGGGPRCQQEDCSTSARSGYGLCSKHLGGKRCSHPDCTTSAREPDDLCGKHGGGRCAHPGCDKAGRGRFCVEHGGNAPRKKKCAFEGCSHLVSSGEVCGTHGARRLCLHAGCTKWGREGGYCVAHNGGKRCESEACAVYDVPPYAGYRSGTLRLCWGCFVALEPERARVKVRKEHYILSELNSRMPELLGRAREAVWDCRVPGGRSLKRPDMLYVFEDRYVQIEVDELGHTDYDCHDEDARLEIISADIGLPGLVVRLNPDEPPCFGRKRLANGETVVQVKDAKAFGELLSAACGAIETYLSVPPPPSLIKLHFPRAWTRAVPTTPEASALEEAAGSDWAVR